jgi:hypothetical protein
MPGYTIGRRILGAQPPADRALLWAGAVLGVLGLVVQVVATSLRPGHVDPNNSAAVFQEYAQSSIWTAVHIGQFIGTPP